LVRAIPLPVAIRPRFFTIPPFSSNIAPSQGPQLVPSSAAIRTPNDECRWIPDPLTLAPQHRYFLVPLFFRYLGRNFHGCVAPTRDSNRAIFLCTRSSLYSAITFFSIPVWYPCPFKQTCHFIEVVLFCADVSCRTLFTFKGISYPTNLQPRHELFPRFPVALAISMESGFDLWRSPLPES